MTTYPSPEVRGPPARAAVRTSASRETLNGRRHLRFVQLFMIVVLAHWAEHVFQAVQIWVLGWQRPQALGAIGQVVPGLVSSEWLHYGYAVVMLVGLIVLRHGFTGRARSWWLAALAIQVWHHFEHVLLLSQALAHHPLFGAEQPTSIIQLLAPRVELHLFYNAVVFTPMVFAVYLQYMARPAASGRARPRQHGGAA
ncbi:MAG TPA: hypothetical protein VGO80_23070 [Solirubrobacteraceae bacterium]|jgi:hypothetical protein|nr:hypothetical protein [Solirubrobacteraceae bacterium]